jgi:arylsulfatase A-like enzyme
LGIRNGGKTITPAINGLIEGGVTLSSYYTFRVCSPTRASLMTGRYPWGVGYYDMSDDGSHCVDPRFKMLPQVLKEQGYRTHAVGKWDVGYIQRHCLPTYRGFDTFLGYYTACTADYWLHGSPGDVGAHGKCNDIDFHDSVGTNISGATMSGPGSVNNTYDQVVFTQRAVKHIFEHAADNAAARRRVEAEAPLYLYLAYHNVHDACVADRFTGGLNAPYETVQRYERTKLDTWKVQAAMTTELDYGVGNVTAALKASGLWNNTVLLFMSDNGEAAGRRAGRQAAVCLSACLPACERFGCGAFLQGVVPGPPVHTASLCPPPTPSPLPAALCSSVQVAPLTTQATRRSRGGRPPTTKAATGWSHSSTRRCCHQAWPALLGRAWLTPPTGTRLSPSASPAAPSRQTLARAPPTASTSGPPSRA